MTLCKEYVMNKVLSYAGMGLGIAVMVFIFSNILPPPHCDLFGNCLEGYEFLNR